MSTTKKDLEDRMAKIRSHMITLSTLIERMDKDVDIHFEIGFHQSDGTTNVLYASKDIQSILNLWHAEDLSEERGHHIDVWCDGKPVADITMPPRVYLYPAKLISSKVHFEINRKIKRGDTVKGHGLSYTVQEDDYETMFRSDSAIACQQEWFKRNYTKEEYNFDIRERPEGMESYHVADIDINTLTPEKLNVSTAPYNKDWLVTLIKNYTAGDGGKMVGVPEALADRILEVFKREND